MTKSTKDEGVQEKMELLQILVTREKVEQIVLDQHEKFSKPDLTRQGQMFGALAYIQCAKSLLSVVSKEKAKKAVAKTTYDDAYLNGRAYAEKRGNPKDLDSYLECKCFGELGRFPFIPPIEILEKTKTRIVYGMQICPWADSVRELAGKFPDRIDQDVLEVVTSRCETLDSGYANGFNPDMKFKRTQYMLDDLVGGPPSKGCYWEAEVPE